MYSHRFFNDSQAALSFMISQASRIESEVYEIQYPDIQYPGLIPVDTTGPEWIKSVTFFSLDKAGSADFINGGSNSMPLANTLRDKHEEQIYMAGLGYEYGTEELAQAQMAGVNLSSEKADAARRGSEEFVDDIALRGHTQTGMQGLINHSAITKVSAPNGASGTATWPTKTPDEIIKDVNSILAGIWIGSLTVEMADTLLLDLQSLVDISTRRIPDTSMTILDYIREKNVYTLQTGQPLTIRGVRGLETAGTGSTRRMVAYRRNPSVLKLHMPMPHKFLPVWQHGPMAFMVPGILRLGGLEIRRPGAARYMDGI